MVSNTGWHLTMVDDNPPALPRGCTLERSPERDVLSIDYRSVRRNGCLLVLLTGFCLFWSAGSLGLTYALTRMPEMGLLTRFGLLLGILLIGWAPAFFIGRGVAMARAVEHIGIDGGGIDLWWLGWFMPKPIRIARDNLDRLTLEYAGNPIDPETIPTLNLYTERPRGLAGRRNILAYHLHDDEKQKLFDALREVFEARGLEVEYKILPWPGCR